LPSPEHSQVDPAGEAFGFATDCDVWVSGRRVAVSGPAQEWLFSGASLAEVVTRLATGPPLTEAALDHGPGSARRLLALRRLRGMRLARRAGEAAPKTELPATLPISGHPLRSATDCRSPLPGKTLLVVLEGDPAGAIASLAANLGAAHLDPAQAWLPLRLDGPLPWAGPLFGPWSPGPARACPHCLVLRLRGTTEVARAALADPSARRLRQATPTMNAERVAALLAELDRVLAEDPAVMRGTMLSAGPHGIARHPAVSGACGCAADPAISALPLGDRVARLCDPLTGPVPLLVDLSAPGDALQVASGTQSPTACWAGLPPPGLETLAAIARGNNSGGCGADAAAARFSAAMEGIECYASLWRGGRDGVATVAAFATLPAGAAIPPQALLNFGDPQRPAFAAALDEALPRPWCEAVELDAEGGVAGPVLLPLALTHDGVPTDGAALWETNGLGAGATREEALAHALAELVERDAVAIWWHNALPRPRLALPRGDAVAAAAVADHRRRGRDVALLDLTHDLGVPVRAALTWDPATGGAICAGFAADPDPRRADRRALAEACLRLPALDLWRSGRGMRRGRLAEWFAQGRLEDLPWLLGGPAAAPEGLPAAAAMAVEMRLAVLLLAIRGAGLRPLVVDLLRPDVGIPVVKAFVPGLRHTRNRLGAGRLYDVPVRLGWLARPRLESELLRFPEGLW
jgi:ribosomal protein S12 methylthiotransferase accessory factor